jgi:hypothetical protein
MRKRPILAPMLKRPIMDVLRVRSGEPVRLEAQAGHISGRIVAVSLVFF